MQERIVQSMVMMMVNHWTWAQIRLRPDRIDHVHHRLGIILLLHHRHGILTLGNLEINGKDGQIQVTANGVAGSPHIIVDRVTKTDSLVRKMTCSLALLHLCDRQDLTEDYQVKNTVLCECIVLSFHWSGACIHARKTLLGFNKRPCIFMHDLWNKTTDFIHTIFLCRYRLYPTWVDLKDLKTHVTLSMSASGSSILRWHSECFSDHLCPQVGPPFCVDSWFYPFTRHWWDVVQFIDLRNECDLLCIRLYTIALHIGCEINVCLLRYLVASISSI